jgi:hypothetical protein
MATRSPSRTPHLALACPGLRHLAHPGYTCGEEDALRFRIVAHCGPQALRTLPARALAGTTFGPRIAA